MCLVQSKQLLFKISNFRNSNNPKYGSGASKNSHWFNKPASVHGKPAGGGGLNKSILIKNNNLNSNDEQSKRNKQDANGKLTEMTSKSSRR